MGTKPQSSQGQWKKIYHFLGKLGQGPGKGPHLCYLGGRVGNLEGIRFQIDRIYAKAYKGIH